MILYTVRERGTDRFMVATNERELRRALRPFLPEWARPEILPQIADGVVKRGEIDRTYTFDWVTISVEQI